MKVLLINGSPRRQGNTHLALQEVAKQLEKQGIESIKREYACHNKHAFITHEIAVDSHVEANEDEHKQYAQLVGRFEYGRRQHLYE